MRLPLHSAFGVVRTGAGSDLELPDALRREVEAIAGTTARAVSAGVATCGVTGDGRLVGVARLDDSFLLLLGALQRPLPDWGEGSPLDDPDATATFLLRRYRALGLSFLDDTVGAFVVALWDADAGRFVLANDPRGMRTAYWTNVADGVAFCTTLYPLGAVSERSGAIDRSLEDFLLGYEFLPWQHTVYEGVRSLAPGTLLSWRGGSLERTASRAPDDSGYTMAAQVGDQADEDEVGDALYDLFLQCVDDVMPSDARVAVLLGGFDSALVVAACRALGREVDTYTFRFPDGRHDQAHVEAVADLFGAAHHWVDIDPSVVREGIERYAHAFDQPSGMPHYLVQTAHVLRRMRVDGHVHALTGDGCDEIFLGYPSVYKRARLFERFRSVPEAPVRLASWVLGRRSVEGVLGQPARFVRNFLRIALRPMPRRGHISNRVFDERSLSFLRSERVLQAVESETVLAALATGLEHLSPLRLAYHGKSMPGLNKVKLAGSSASSGLTVLSPFQHPHLVAFARSLPETMLRPRPGEVGSATGKRVLMRAVERRGVLPAEIIYQRKASPVAGMADDWYLGPLRPFMLERMEQLPFAYDRAYAASLLHGTWFESLFRRRISLGSYVLTAPAMLVTYAAFHRQPAGHDPAPEGSGAA